MNIIWKLLRKNISIAQLAGFMLANFVGLAIVVSGIQMYEDVKSIWQSEDSFIKKDYIVINKEVENRISFADKTSFTDDEISDIESQEWVRKVGRFQSADYKVFASVSGVGRSMSTYMFFESIPSEFIDVDSRAWQFTPGDIYLPIIISKDYLSLYNFGFAGTVGMPQVSEEVISAIPLNISLRSDNGMADYSIKGRIVGFSNRLNTILVPQEFMDWSNARFGTTAKSNMSRLIIEVSSPGDVKIAEYLDAHGYEMAGDKDASTAAYFLNVAAGVVVSIGFVITLLSFFILLLSISLLMQKNREKMHSLLMLGYGLKDVGRPYSRLVVAVNVAAYLMAVVAMLLFRNMYLESVRGMGAEEASLTVALSVGAILTLVIAMFNIEAIRRKVKKAF